LNRRQELTSRRHCAKHQECAQPDHLEFLQRKFQQAFHQRACWLGSQVAELVKPLELNSCLCFTKNLGVGKYCLKIYAHDFVFGINLADLAGDYKHCAINRVNYNRLCEAHLIVNNGTCVAHPVNRNLNSSTHG
jgi:hypothetical protein